MNQEITDQLVVGSHKSDGGLRNYNEDI